MNKPLASLSVVLFLLGTAMLAMGDGLGPAPLSSVYPLGQARVPFVYVSSGTMGNNGALSGLTALQHAYPDAYVYLPAGAIAASGPGSAAGWYYAQFSSATAATVYNNTYTSGTPQIPASPTAFSTTGPGAFTQTTGSYIPGYTLSIAGGTIGINGSVEIKALANNNSSVNNKTVRIQFGGAMNLAVITQTSSNGSALAAGFSNCGKATAQVIYPYDIEATTGGAVYGLVNTANAQQVQVYFNLATATDTMVIENVQVNLIPGVA